jgi:hypothetical protein
MGANATRNTFVFSSNGTLNVTGNLTTGTLTANSSLINLGGSFAPTTFNANTGTVDFNGSVAQTIAVSVYNFNNIQVDNTNLNGATLDAAVTATDITGNINVNNGSFNTGNFAVVLAPSRGITVAAGATFDAGTTSIKFGTTPLAATINGTFQTANTTGFSGAAGAAISNTNAPTITLGASSTIEYTVLTGGQAITGRTYSNLMLDNTSGTNTAGGGITVNGILTTTAGGTLDFGAANLLSLGGASTIANAGTIKTSVPTATSATPIPAGKTWGGTIEFGVATGAQTVAAGTYNNLKTDNTSGTNATGGNLTVNGTLTTTAGGTLDMGASNILSGTLTTISNAGTIKTSVPTATSATPIPTGKTWGGTVEYGALTGAQTVVAGIYNNLKLDNTSGSNAAGGDITVSGTLTLAAGTFAVGANTLTLNGSTIAGTPASLSTTSSSSLTFGGTTAGVLIPGSITALNNLSVSNTNSVTLQSSPTISGFFDPQGAGLSIGVNTLTLSGQVNCGTLTGGASSNITINGTGSANLSAVSLGNLTINRATGVSLCGNVTVNGILTLTSGVLQLVAYNLTLANTTAIAGAFSATSMIETNGAGFLIRSANATNASFNGTLPVGNGSYYEPVIISGLTGAVAAARNLYVRSVPTNPAIFGNGINKYWDFTGTTITVGAGTVSLQYNNNDVTGNQTVLQPYTNTNGSWQLATNPSAAGVNPMTSISSATLTGYWTAGSPNTYYSYQSGNWNLSTTWTTDPSGTLSVNQGVPGFFDNVVILNGRTVNVSNNGKQIGSLEIRLGGYLDLASTSGHTFGTVTGQGVLRLSSGNFPTGTFTAFVAATGGTVEYYNLNNTSISNVQLTYNNLIVSNYTGSANAVFLDNVTNPVNYTINGKFDLKNNSSGSLTFYFGNPTVSDNLINMTVYGNFTVSAGSNILVNNFASGHAIPNPGLPGAPSNYGPTAIANYPVHTLYLNGNFTNNGTVRFTGWPSPVANGYYIATNTNNGTGTNYGHVQVDFVGASNNTVTCNGITDFFRIIVEKGTDQTYTVDVASSNTNNFGLYGPNYQGSNQFNGNPEGYGIGAYYKALFLHYGTLKLGANINVPSLTEGGQDYNLIPTAALWVDGANVSTTVVGVNGTGYQAATLYGRLRISAGQFTTGDAAGIVLGTLGTPEILVEGTGTFNTSQVWASAGTNIISYTQTGGTTNFGQNAEYHGNAMLGLNSTNSVFNMSGGTINFSGNIGGNDFQLMNIAATSGNYKVTGGTININEPSSATVYTAISSVPFYNMNITNQTGTGTTTVQWSAPSPLTILGNLSIGAGSVLDMNTNTINLNVAQNFSIAASGTYAPGNNTTTFNGIGGQIFTNAGTITSGPNNNLVISNSSNTNITNNLSVTGNLTINSSCFLNDQGNSINVGGNIVNSGTHTSQANGAIILNGAGAQTIGGNGSGVFGNFAVNKGAGSSSFTSNQAITGNLRLANGILDINHYQLTFSATSNVYDALAGITAVFGNTKMITLSGMVSDGGIVKPYNAIGSFIFPIGNAGGYRPATIAFSQVPTTWGSVNVKIGARLHPLATSANALKYYWKVVSTGFTGIPANSVSHTYHFINPGDINAGNLNNYIPGVYNPYAWVYINDVSQVNKINYNVLFTNVGYLDGEYTAGQPDAFGTVNIFYSRKATGNWSDNDMWSVDQVAKWGGVACNCFPATDDIVLIGDGSTYNHNVTVTAASGAITVGSLTINTGSTLDLATTTGHNFGVSPDQKITGSGTLRISSAAATAAFPGGDFGNFLNTGGGTVEYYNTAAIGNATITLPTTYNVGATIINIINYNNLNLNPAPAKNVILPNTDLTVFGNFTANGSGLAEFNTQAATRTITVNGNTNVSSGTLEFMNGNNTAQNIVVNGDVLVSAGATFDVANANTATNTMSIQGSLVNNGIFNMYKAAGRVCDVTFTGALNKGISGTGATTSFDILTVNKGTDRNSLLEVTSNAFSLNTTLATALTLNNGTFRLTSPLAITLTTTAAFTIPISGCLSANGGTINIGQNNTTGADLLLQGRLEILSGAVNIGLIAGATSDNDIEYASAGNPEIIVSGGTLLVNGQIRRNLNNTLGSLWYTQSGGTVTVRGLASNNTRGMFEVANTGSQFNMSGGTLNIERSGSVNYADAYIVPASSNVTGGIVQFGNTNTLAGQTSFTLNSSSPIGSITVDGTTRNKTVTLAVNPLSIVNDLTINGAGSSFNASGLNVNIGRNLTNNNTVNTVGTANGGYQPGSATQITTFNGANPALVTGTAGNLTNFANMVMASSSTVTLSSNSNLAVNSNLTLNSGTLADGGNIVTAYGNIVNNATHTSSGGNGIVMAGAQEQIISGSGSGVFGNVNINNTNGVNLVDNSTVNGVLTLSNGVLYIDDYQLTLGASATIAGTFSTTKMIALNGVISDQGVVKNTSGTLTNYLIPLGVAGKYTPATFSVTSATAGSIKVLPVNMDHPADFDANGNELAYYWKVIPTGLTVSSATQVFNYLVADVSGNEGLYHGARYLNGQFTDLGTGVINTTNHTITVTGAFVDGEYTAGEAANFTNKHKLYSKSSGNWTDNIWAEDAPGNPLCGYYPNGNPTYIQPGHTITMNIDNSFAYSVDIPATAVLDMSDKLYSDLGFITGTGKIRLKGTAGGSFIFPGGNYDAFMADPTGQSTVEFYGTIDATLPLKPGNIYKPYQNVIFTDAGIKYMSAENMKVLKNLTINNTASLNNTLQNKSLFILGNWVDNNATTSGFVPGTGLVSFEGTVAQQLTVVNNLTENYYDFRISNPAGLSLITGGGAGDGQISDNLYLANGVIYTNTTNTLTLNNSSPSAAIRTNANSFIDGPLYKNISSGSYFDFPVGNSGRYGNVYVSNVSAAGIWTGEYFNAPPTYNVNSKLTPIDQVSDNEYWWISGPAASQGNVRLRWDANSGFASSTLASRSKIRAIEWNPTPGQWEYRGKILNDGGPTTGTVQTDNIISLALGANLHYLTIGMESLPTATITSTLTPSICADGTSSTTISIALTGTAPWSLSYKLGAVTTTLTNIASSPASIVITSASPGITGTGNFSFNITNVNDAVGIPGVKDYTTTATVTIKPVPNPSPTGRTTVGTSEAGVAYSTTSVGGDTYLWAVTGGSIAGGQNTAAITVNWGAATGTFAVSVTETNGAPNNCSITKSLAVTIVNAPTPNVTGNTNVCANDNNVAYATPGPIATHTYLWTVTGGNIASGQGTAGIIVNWLTAGSGSVKVAETFGSTVSSTLPVTINPLPTANNTVLAPAICNGQDAVITVNGADGSGTDYQLRTGTTPVAGALYHNTVAGANISLTVTPGPIVNTIYNVLATNQYACSVQLNNTASILVNPVPAVTTDPVNRTICQANNTTFSIVATGATAYQWQVNQGSGWSDLTNTVPYSTVTTNTLTITAATTTMNAYQYRCRASNAFSCSVNSNAGILTVTTLPAATISYAGTPFCSTVATAQAVTLTGTAGGSYSAAPVGLTINAGTGAITPSTSAAGIYTVTYTMTAAGGCALQTATTSVTITALPVATFSYTGTPYCSNAANPLPTLTGSAGTFSSTAGLNFVSTATGQVNLATSTAGIYTVTNTIAAAGGCALVTATSGITITTLPSATISYAGTPFCSSVVGVQGVTLTGTSGGAYSAPAGLLINAGTGAITPSTSTAGIYTVTYTIAAANGCGVVTATTSVTITTLPSATISYAGTPFCTSVATAQAVTRTGTAGGAYSAPAGLSINVGTGAITPSTSTAGIYTVTYTMAAAGGCALQTATTSVTITALPVATFSYTGTPYCSNAANPLPTLTGSAGTFSSTAGLNFVSTATGQINLATSTAGTYTVTNTIATAGGCALVSATSGIKINPLPSPTFTGGPISACANSVGNVYTTQAGMSSYVWTVIGGSITAGGGASNNTVTVKWGAAGTGHVTINYNDSNGCSANSATDQSVTVTPLPVTGPAYREANN